ncbi:MAG: glycosyl transferase [Alteromonas sp.]|nr:glycosyl transferase [Alteromonas sp.]MAY22872.1 glycosyl transferase [Flavobacteriaceae bacterium]|tara:strand:- start:20631 stop:21713 length:1083 start_codon:yes stop_codon:yes gene_type:complete
MRILQVIPNLETGGAEKLLVDSIPKYLEKGIQMELLLLDNSPSQFLELLKNNKQVVVHQLNSKSPYRPSHILRLIPFIKKFDVLHVHLFPALYWVAFAKLLSLSKKPLVYTEHNTFNKRRIHWLLKYTDRLAYRMYKKIITISIPVDTALKRFLKTKKDNYYFIPNGVDLSVIQNAPTLHKEQLAVSENQKIVLQVSSFTPQKDQKTLIKSLVYLPENVLLFLVGAGPTMEAHKQFVKDCNLESRVFFLGIRMDVPSLLKSVDVVVLSSHYEGLSLSSIEGLASGNPFVASNVSGLKEIVEGAGALFDEGNEKQLAKILKRCMEDAPYRDTLISKCQERAKVYDMDVMVQSHIELYKKLK